MARSTSVETAAAAPVRGIALPNLLGIAMNFAPPRSDKQDDESVVCRRALPSARMQLAYDHEPAARDWHLRGLLSERPLWLRL